MTVAAITISAGAEWRAVRNYYGKSVQLSPNGETSPFGEWFEMEIAGLPVVFVQGGWGKISAAASTQYLLGRWKPEILINLGTCGGFAGEIERGTIVMAERTLVYDIIEQMGDPQAAIRHYSVDLDLSWLHEPYPQPVHRGLLVSADRDICLPDIPMLMERYHAFAADWESGAIAWVASRNGTRCLILRGVSDLVGAGGGEAYGAIEVFHEASRQVMEPMLKALPEWLACCR
jgi:adenosylhomocysteine nucleosidase